IFFSIFGLAGIAVLLQLGFWQLDRLEWKENLLSEIDQRLLDDAVAVPAAPNEADDNFRRVSFDGVLTGRAAHVLTSEKGRGPGYRIVAGAESTEHRLLIDLGFVPQAEKEKGFFGRVTVTGNLYWPNEVDPNYTPDPDLEENIFFARDLEQMAAFLETDPYLIVATEITPDQSTLTNKIAHDLPNDHLQYAITWFALAVVWAAMTIYALVQPYRKKAA
ncbi:MAG: SURF1 family protein, partial [Pseudomonadota bacterium]